MIMHSAFKNRHVLNISETQFHKQLSDLDDSSQQTSEEDFEVELKMRASKKSVMDTSMSAHPLCPGPPNLSLKELAVLMPAGEASEFFHFTRSEEVRVQRKNTEAVENSHKYNRESPLHFKRATSMRPKQSGSRMSSPFDSKGLKPVSPDRSERQLDFQMAVINHLQSRNQSPDGRVLHDDIPYNTIYDREKNNLQSDEHRTEGEQIGGLPGGKQISEKPIVGRTSPFSQGAKPANTKGDYEAASCCVDEHMTPSQSHYLRLASIVAKPVQDSGLRQLEEDTQHTSITEIEEESLLSEDSPQPQRRAQSSKTVLQSCCEDRTLFYLDELFEQWKHHLPKYYKVHRNRRVVNTQVHYKMRIIEADLKELARDGLREQELADIEQEMEALKQRHKSGLVSPDVTLKPQF